MAAAIPLKKIEELHCSWLVPLRAFELIKAANHRWSEAITTTVSLQQSR
jgi:hypothetical protein